MARMPGATWKPLASNYASQPAMQRYDQVVIHTMVGSLAGTDSYFRSGNGAGFAGTESHFGTGSDGTIWQWQDTSRRADANGDGNHRIISIENADYGVGFGTWNTNDGGAVPAFTPAQIESIARICAWAYKTHGIPLVAAKDSKPTTRGIGFHRLGVNPYRVAGGEVWSSAYGKVCPGARRKAQIPSIIARAREIAGLSGGTAAKPLPPIPSTPTPKPTTPEDDMPSADEVASLVVAKLLKAEVSEGKPFAPAVSQSHTQLTEVFPSLVKGEDGKPLVEGDFQAYLRYIDRHAYELNRVKVPLLLAQQAAQGAVIQELVKVVADGEGFDALELQQAVAKAVDDALAGKVVFDVDQVNVAVNEPTEEPSA